MPDGKVIIEIDADTKSFEEEIKQTEQYLNKLVSSYEKVANMKGKLKPNEEAMANLRREIEKTNNKLIELREKQDNLDKPNTSKILDYLKNIGKETEKNIKKVGKWALAIFGIRSAYMGIRRAISLVTSDNENISNQINIMKSAIANALTPAVQKILDIIAKIMIYINAIFNALTDKNLFDFDKAFKNANKNAKGTAKSVNQIKKDLAGFDEMNILSDNSSSDVGDVGGGNQNKFKNPFEGWQNIKVPWLEWLVKNKDKILSVIGGITAGLLAWKLGLNALQSVGIGIAITGIIYAIQKIIDFINDPTFENFIGILEGIAVAVAGVAIAFEAWPVAIGAVVALVVIEIVKHFDKIKELFAKLIDWLDKNVLGGLRTLFGPVGDILYMPIKWFVEIARKAFETFYGGVKQIVDGVVKIFKGDFWGGIKSVFGGLIDVMTAPLQALIKAAQALWGHIKESVNYWATQFKNNFDKIKGYFLSPINNFIDGIKGLWNKIKGTVEDVSDKIKNAFNPVNLVADLGKGLKSFGSKIGSLFGFAKGGIIVPKLASGGIINQPGRGVPLASAIGGERGAEGVIPLTDSQQMALLGEAIGRYITINANIVNTMNGRVISKELQKVQNESDFAYNR